MSLCLTILGKLIPYAIPYLFWQIVRLTFCRVSDMYDDSATSEGKHTAVYLVSLVTDRLPSFSCFYLQSNAPMPQWMSRLLCFPPNAKSTKKKSRARRNEPKEIYWSIDETMWTLWCVSRFMTLVFSRQGRKNFQIITMNWIWNKA